MNRALSALAAGVLSTALIAFVPGAASADDAAVLKDEIAELKQTIAALKTRLTMVESERDALQLRLNRLDTEATKAENDLFQVGTRWEGSRFLYAPKGKARDPGQKWGLVVTERDGERFKGEIHFVGRDKKLQQLDVSGSAPTKANGRIVFKTEAIGVLQQSFEGVLKGDQISLTWEGNGLAGRKLGGTANLSR